MNDHDDDHDHGHDVQLKDPMARGAGLKRANTGFRSNRSQTLRASPNGMLEPLTSKPKQKLVFVYDIESKDVPRDLKGNLVPFTDVLRPNQKLKPGDEAIYDRFLVDKHGNCQHEGFARAFLCGFYDGKKFQAFKNDPNLLEELNKLEPEDRAVKKGGCIDRFMRHVTGDNMAYRSNVASWYGHNAGRFDSTFVLAWLIEHQAEFECIITSVHGRAQQLVFWKRSSSYDPKAKKRKEYLSWTFQDSALILPMSLAEACDTFNKQKDPSCLSCQKDACLVHGVQKLADFDRNMHEADERWYTYNAADCRGLYGALASYRRMLASIGGEIGMTAPATAMKLYRRKFMTAPISIHRHFPTCDGKCHRIGHGKDKKSCSRLRHCDGKCHGCLHDWIRSGYFGGRTEIYHRFAPKGIYYFDINSSYPASMLEAMPVGDAKIFHGPELYHKLHKKMSLTHVGFVECVVFIPEGCPIPPLPMVKDHKLKFETGYVCGVFEYDELQLIFDPAVNGHIVSVVRSVWYRKEHIFKDFVNTLYDFRKSHFWDEESQGYLGKVGWSKALSELAKLLMNSLYGKFAMSEEREELLLFDPNGPEDFPDGEPLNGQPEICAIWKMPRFIEPRYIIPQVSARITALSRARLWRAMRDILFPPEGSIRRAWTQEQRDLIQLFYGDTDSLMTNLDMAKYKEFDVGGDYDYKLGAWKREHPGKILSGEYVLPKMYALELFDEATGLKVQGYDKKGFPAGDIIKMKGVQRDSLTRENYEILRGGTNADWGDARPRKGGAVGFYRVAQHRTVIRKKWLGPRLIPASKSVQTQYDKRKMAPDGSTKPFHNAVPPQTGVPPEAYSLQA